MLRPRIIPCLLIRDRGLVKTVKFKDAKYVGDPLNAVKIFNEKEVDELMVLDIDATSEGREPDYDTIQKLASECRMPFCYGGGISSADQARQIIGRGVEKVALNAAVVARPQLVREIADEIGSQSVVVVLDVKKKLFGGKYELYTRNGRHATGLDPVAFAQQVQELGVGEIVINAIDQDGMMKGYDLALVDKIRAAVTVPLTVLGGAGTLDDIGTLIGKYGIIGAAAGSLFVFKGSYKAVLINYPGMAERDRLIEQYR